MEQKKLPQDLGLTWELSRVWFMNDCISHLEEDLQVPEILLSVFRDLATICSCSTHVTTFLNTCSVPRSFRFSPVLTNHPSFKAHYSHWGGESTLPFSGLEAPGPDNWNFEGFSFFSLCWEKRNSQPEDPGVIHVHWLCKELVGGRSPKVLPLATWAWLLVVRAPGIAEQENQPKWAWW